MLKKNTSIIIISIACILLVLSLIGYRTIKENNGGEYEVVVILKNRIFTEYWLEVKYGIEKAASLNDVNVTFLAAVLEDDIKRQKEIIDEAIEKEPDAIILAANDYINLIRTAEKIKEYDIQLVLIDSGSNYGDFDSFVGTNNYEAGFIAGEAMSKEVLINNKINIMNYVVGSPTADKRELGVRNGLIASGKDYEITTYFCNDNKDEAIRITNNFINDGQEIGGIISLNETSTDGVAEAIDKLGLSNTIKVIGFDSSIEEIGYLEKGTITALVVQNPFNMGYIGIETAIKLIRVEKVEKEIDTGSKIIYKKNMYDKENIDLLFPFVE